MTTTKAEHLRQIELEIETQDKTESGVVTNKSTEIYNIGHYNISTYSTGRGDASNADIRFKFRRYELHGGTIVVKVCKYLIDINSVVSYSTVSIPVARHNTGVNFGQYTVSSQTSQLQPTGVYTHVDEEYVHVILTFGNNKVFGDVVIQQDAPVEIVTSTKTFNGKDDPNWTPLTCAPTLPILVKDVDYGTKLPTTNLIPGRIFYLEHKGN